MRPRGGFEGAKREDVFLAKAQRAQRRRMGFSQRRKERKEGGWVSRKDAKNAKKKIKKKKNKLGELCVFARHIFNLCELSALARHLT